MTLEPLLDAPALIQVHAFAALSAFGLGLAQLVLPKGTSSHRVIGWTWVVLLLIVSLSSFFIHQIRLWGAFSPIHLLSILTLATLPLGVLAAHHHRVTSHKVTMILIFAGALVLAGAFTFLPGRIMHAVAWGSP
jgi:uncharacterized membrane protein